MTYDPRRSCSSECDCTSQLAHDISALLFRDEMDGQMTHARFRKELRALIDEQDAASDTAPSAPSTAGGR